MRVLKNIARVICILAGVVVIGSFFGSQYGPFTDRFADFSEQFAFHVVLIVCMVILGLNTLLMLGRLLFERRPPTCVHTGGDPDIEVTLAAITSVARAAAQEDPDVMIEDLTARVVGRDRSTARVAIDAISLTGRDLESTAQRMQQRVTDACRTMLGTEGVTVRVRFLPSKTTTIKEVPGEQ